MKCERKCSSLSNIKPNLIQSGDNTMFKRELTNLEERLYDFLDFADSTLEYDVSQKSWEKLREAMKLCKEDCKVKYGVINNGYSLHVELPFDADKYMKQQKQNKCLQAMKEDPAANKLGEFIVNQLGINLVSVDGIKVERQHDGQITDIHIAFIPSPKEA